MKYDQIIIGGGLSGLVCGIALAKAGKKVAIVAAGQSILHFSSGSFDLLGYDAEGNAVENPLEAVSNLDEGHPYKKIGVDRLPSLADEAVSLFQAAGVSVNGNAAKNHYRITPMGMLKPTWLTLAGNAVSEDGKTLSHKRILLANIIGFMDFPVSFIADSFTKLGVQVETKDLEVSALRDRRHSPSEMRSANIAKVLSCESTIQELADQLNVFAGDVDAIYMPTVVGLTENEAFETLRSKVNKPLFMMATLPPSVSGVRVQNLLKKEFTKLGGTFMLGSKALKGVVSDDKVVNIEVSSLPDEKLEASEYVLATGSFQSNGLVSNYIKVYEPIFDLDVDAAEKREDWVNSDAYKAQPYMKFGVTTNAKLQVQKGGKTIQNMYAVGSVLSGHNSIKQADGEGVDMMSALAVAKTILNK